MDPSSRGTADKDTDVPSLSDLGYLEAARTPFKVRVCRASMPDSDSVQERSGALAQPPCTDLHHMAVSAGLDVLLEVDLLTKRRGCSAMDKGWCTLSSCRLQGGETEALARLAEQLSNKAWVAQFEKPKGDPTAFDPSPATTILSPYLKFGCISPRLFYESLQLVSSLNTPRQPPSHFRHHFDRMHCRAPGRCVLTRCHIFPDQYGKRLPCMFAKDVLQGVHARGELPLHISHSAPVPSDP